MIAPGPARRVVPFPLIFKFPIINIGELTFNGVLVLTSLSKTHTPFVHTGGAELGNSGCGSGHPPMAVGTGVVGAGVVARGAELFEGLTDVTVAVVDGVCDGDVVCWAVVVVERVTGPIVGVSGGSVIMGVGVITIGIALKLNFKIQKSVLKIGG